ncbi:MAG TPA: Ig domain-containing protein [Bryobacteraceae bacterium]|jgi:hypothetical protein
MRSVLVLLSLSATAALAAVTINPPDSHQITQPFVLPQATTGTFYSFTFTAQGVAPFRWSFSSGNIPPWAQLDASCAAAPIGCLMSGTPTAPGSYSFAIQAIDAAGGGATAQFSLTVLPGPLFITTINPLFGATVGTNYSQQFQAEGGVQPYSWSITSGSTGSLTLNSSTGILSGVPTTQGTLSFTVQVKDAAGVTSVALTNGSQPFSITADYPPPVIGATSLPSASLGIPYTQPLSASGGLAPYAWSIVSGAVPGLSINAATGVLSGTPTPTAGVTYPATYQVKIQLTDSATNPQHSTSRTFPLIVSPAALTITTQSPLTGGTAGVAYSQPLAALGGAAPYSWSATGLPTGLVINPNSGTISGTPQAAGSFQVPVTVTDNNRNVTVQLFSMTFALPPTPNISLTGIPSSANLAGQVPVQVSIDQTYSGDITGQIGLSFAASQQGANDGTIQFSTGGTTAGFTIPAGQTSAVFSTPLAFQTGTLPGTITVSLPQVTAFTVNVTPSTPPSQAVTISSSAPVISSAQLIVSGQNVSVQVVGYSPTREVSQAVFTFSASGSTQLQTSQFTVQPATAFSTWFKDPNANNFGSQFLYTQTFAVQGDPSGVALQSVSLTNQQGTTQFAAH